MCIMAAFMTIRKPKIYHPRRSDHHVHDYKRLFRFDENNVNWIVRNVLLDNNEVETRGGALSTKQQGFQVGVGEDLGIDQASACRSIHHICDKIVQIADKWIKFPQKRQEKETASSMWATKYFFHKLLGRLIVHT